MKKIGITTSQMIMVDHSLCGNKKTSVNTLYVESIRRQGALPVILPCISSKEENQEYIKMCDGFLLTGGMDIAPLLYKEMPQSKCGPFDYEVDQSQLDLVKMILDSGKPVLAICRGMQQVNIALGGTLIQDIPSQKGYGNHSFDYDGNLVHAIEIEKDSLLYEILKKEELLVNSLHHQALGKLGEGMEIMAKAPDGIVEAAGIRERKILGVQWHPELLMEKGKDMNRLFQWLIKTVE